MKSNKKKLLYQKPICTLDIIELEFDLVATSSATVEVNVHHAYRPEVISWQDDVPTYKEIPL